jgi:hypothetical protein
VLEFDGAFGYRFWWCSSSELISLSRDRIAPIVISSEGEPSRTFVLPTGRWRKTVG